MPQPIIGINSAATELKAAERTDANGRRRIVWILPRANDVDFEYVKRCESCPRLHDGQYGSGRFCSSRCARRVGGLAKKRMWDLTHGVSANVSEKRARESEISRAPAAPATRITHQKTSGLPPIRHTIPVPPTQVHRSEVYRTIRISTAQSVSALSAPKTEVKQQADSNAPRKGNLYKMSLTNILNPEP